MDQMTAVQRLARLKQIEHQMLTGRNAEHPALRAEKAEILARVDLPPMELCGNPWGGDWARAFCDVFPGFQVETMDVWFKNACAAGAQQGALEAQAEANADLVQALESVRAGLAQGKLRALGSVTVDGVEMTWSEFLADAMQNASKPLPPVVAEDVCGAGYPVDAPAVPAPDGSMLYAGGAPAGDPLNGVQREPQS